MKVNEELGLLSEAYSPLGTGGLLGNEVVNEIANEVGKSPAQVLIRWSLEHGFCLYLNQFTINTLQPILMYLILN